MGGVSLVAVVTRIWIANGTPSQRVINRYLTFDLCGLVLEWIIKWSLSVSLLNRISSSRSITVITTRLCVIPVNFDPRISHNDNILQPSDLVCQMCTTSVGIV